MSGRGYLVVRVSTDSDGKRVIGRFSAPHPLTQPSFATVQAAAQRHGYEVDQLTPASEIDAWPLWLHAYTSPNREGLGRAGSQFTAYRARIRVTR